MEKPYTKPNDVHVWLFQRMQEFYNDPNQAVAGKGCPTVELEKISNNNNLCFWKAVARHDGLEVKWGIFGTIGNRKFFDISECYQKNPARELQSRMQKKLNGAYKLKNFDDIMS